MSMNRRSFLQGAGAALALAAIGAPAIAQARTKVKVGYLHTLAVDGQIWTGMDRGSFAKQGLELELVQFTTGLEIFQAMIGGSIDMLATGAVLSNFPARGPGQGVPDQRRRVRHRAALGARRTRASRASPT